MEATAIRKRTTDATPLIFSISQERLQGAFPVSATVTSSPSGLTVGTPAVYSVGAVVDVSGGTDGASYSCAASITLSDARVVTEILQVVVSNPAVSSETTLLLEEPTYVFTNLSSAVGLLGEYAVKLRLDDDQSGLASPLERKPLLDYAKVATATVRRKCIAYDAAQLARSWSVWNWTTVIYAYWIARRRCNPIPPGLQEAFLETMDELEMIKKGQEFIEDINIALDPTPSWSNLRIDHFYIVSQQRVTRQTSDQRPSTRPQRHDSLGQFSVEAW